MTTRSPSPSLKVQLPAACDPPGENNPAKQAVWVIFGATGHVGRSLVRTALSHDDKVTAVGRTFESTMEQMRGWHDNCLGMLCDVRARETIEHVFQESIKHWGRIDIIANCTGYGVVAPAEDQSEHEIQDQFNTNFLGTLHILQLSLPYFRTNGIPGRYLILSSTNGALGAPGLAPYCATKYAVEGLIESMLYETDCFGIKATLVEPGYMRLDDNDDDSLGSVLSNPKGNGQVTSSSAFSNQSNERHVTPAANSLTPSIRVSPRGGHPSATPSLSRRYGHFSIKPLSPQSAYSSPHSPAGHATRVFQWLNMRQPVSAVRSAELVWQLAHCSYPPLRLLLGNYAVDSVRDRLRSVIEEIEDWKHLSFPGAEDDGGDRTGEETAVGSDNDGDGEGDDFDDSRHDVDGEDGEDEEHDNHENDEMLIDSHENNGNG